jgi:hypothetical protein
MTEKMTIHKRAIKENKEPYISDNFI